MMEKHNTRYGHLPVNTDLIIVQNKNNTCYMVTYVVHCII